MTHTPTPEALPTPEAVMEQAQVFASAWAIFGSGSAFEPENSAEVAAEAKAGLAQMVRRLHARVQELEKAESDLIAERDRRDEIIDRMADAVLGTDRHEWSSVYDLEDAAQEVEDKMAAQAQRVPLSDAECDRLISALCPDFSDERFAGDRPIMRQLARDALATQEKQGEQA